MEADSKSEAASKVKSKVKAESEEASVGNEEGSESRESGWKTAIESELGLESDAE